MIRPNESVDTLLRNAEQARQRGIPDEELRYLDGAIALYPRDPRALNARGMRAMSDRDYATAIAVFTRAAAADPAEPALLVNLASAYRSSGDEEGERRTLQAVLDIDQLYFTAQLRMAELLQRQGLISQAARHWSAVVQLVDGMERPPEPIVDAGRRGREALSGHNLIFERALDAELQHQQPAEEPSRRFKACVDHILGRRKIYRNECAGIYFPFLPADEFFDRNLFPWMTELEAHTEAIAAEAVALVESGGEAIRPYVRLDPGTPANKWSGLDNSDEWSACFLWEYGEPNDAVCALCPSTVAALQAVPQNHVPGRAPTAFFSVLRPGGYIPPHTGVTNTRTIIHLPLVVPPRCRFRVGGETRPWREGEAFGFDDTIEHEAWNDSDAVRIVLIFDVWNPHLTPEEQAHLATLSRVADRGLISPHS